MAKTLEERFWAKVDKTPGHGPNGDCWLWTAAIDSTGYGAFCWNGKKRNTHRIAYELQNGQIDRNMDILHSCDVRLCCNNDHLTAGSRLLNVRDAIAKNRHSRGVNIGSAKLNDGVVLLLRFMHEKHQYGAAELAKIIAIRR